MAVSAHGTLLKMGDGATPQVYTTIGEVKDISGPSYSLSTEAVTSHDSVFEQVVPGIVSLGEVSFDINYTGAVSQKALRTALTTRAPTSFKITDTTGTPETATFDAYVTGFEPSAPVEGVLSASVTLTVESAPVYTS